LGESARDDRDARILELQRELEEVRTRLDETEALARVGSWEWQLPEFQAATWSAELLRIFGRDPAGPPPSIDELISAVHPDDRSGFQELVARIRQTRGPFQYGYRIIDADGEVHHLQARGRTVTDAEGRPTRAYGTTQDISELKRSEEQLEQAQRLEALGQLAGGVAHDFNNLLSVMLNTTEILVEEVDDAEALVALREIEQAGRSAADLTRRLLVFSRREAPELAPVNLVAAVREAEALLVRTIGENIDLTIDVPSRLPPVMLGTGQAEQVLVNLAVNARDAMPNGGTIAISVRELDIDPATSVPVPNLPPGAPHVVLSVADEGVGMSKAVARQAFDPFFTTKPRDKGTGLGLATVYGLATQAGGLVELESEPGNGTAVHIYLPVADLGGGVDLETGKSLPRYGAGRTVLVVDNEKAVLAIVCRMLERHGYKTLAALSGSDAEHELVAAKGNVDLLLTDLQMPGMSGGELVRRLRARHPDLKAIYMSGFASEAAASPGEWDMGRLEKPFTAPQLLRAVGDALEGG
jgi:signal transduction histidine kinase